jgi:hypothetical protein
MTHYRIAGSIWLIFGVIGFTLSTIECVPLLRMGAPLTGGDVLSTLIGAGFCAVAASTSVGLIRARRWARVEFAVMAVLLGLYCLSFLAMAEFPAIFNAFACIGIGIVGYTLTVILICRPHEQMAG